MSFQQRAEQQVIAIRVMMADAVERQDGALALEACKAAWDFVDANPEFQIIAPMPSGRAQYQVPATARQLVAKWGGSCSVCDGRIGKGDIMYWDSQTREMICSRCSISEFHGGGGCSK